MSIQPQQMFEEDLEIKTAYISVFDKTGIVDFAKALVAHGVTIISTGGTYKELKNADIPVLGLSDVIKTYAPEDIEILDGRVKSFHPQILGALLANKANPKHMETLARLGIRPIEMNVCNFYPFEKIAAEPNATKEEKVENVDIGGPTQVRASAKNYGSVCAVTSPDQYASIIGEMNQREGKISFDTREKLSKTAFKVLARDAVEVSMNLGEKSDARNTLRKSRSA